MNRCSRCWMPDTRPGSVFVDGVCGACRNYDKRAEIDWAARWTELRTLCDMYRKDGHTLDCIIPVSGGKDSYAIVKIMVEDMGMCPLLVTVGDSFTHTQAGKHNLRNLIERYDLFHVQYDLPRDLFVRATRAAFESTGEPLKFIETAIYTVPCKLGVVWPAMPLVVFGENSAYEYGGQETDDGFFSAAGQRIAARLFDERAWWEEHGIETQELKRILPFAGMSPRLVFMSYFTPWSSVDNLEVAQKRGFKTLDDTNEWTRQGTIEQFEQIDSVGYMVHLWLKYPKFGFQRAMDIASRRCREGRMTLDEVKEVAEKVDPVLDLWALEDFCMTLGYTRDTFWPILERFWNTDLFEKKGGVWQRK